MYFCTVSVWQHRTSKKDYQHVGQTGVSQSLSQNMSLNGFRNEKTSSEEKKAVGKTQKKIVPINVVDGLSLYLQY